METLQIRDLRIGNILREKYTGDIITVSELTKDRITFDYTTDKKWQSEPIPLTEEWLLKLGFIENSSCFKKGILSFRHYKDIKFIPVIGDYVILNEIKYVHQVQNLVYALTGE